MVETRCTLIVGLLVLSSHVSLAQDGMPSRQQQMDEYRQGMQDFGQQQRKGSAGWQDWQIQLVIFLGIAVLGIPTAASARRVYRARLDRERRVRAGELTPIQAAVEASQSSPGDGWLLSGAISGAVLAVVGCAAVSILTQWWFGLLASILTALPGRRDGGQRGLLVFQVAHWASSVGRTKRCSRPGPHVRFLRFIVALAAPAAELGR